MNRALSMVLTVLGALLAAGVVNAALITALPDRLRVQAVVWVVALAIVGTAGALWWLLVVKRHR
jgi:hypothetical protein